MIQVVCQTHLSSEGAGTGAAIRAVEPPQLPKAAVKAADVVKPLNSITVKI